MPANLPHVGGQAVIEGVMIRAPGSFAVAVRRATGEIVVRERPWRAWGQRSSTLRLPVVRGVAALLEGIVAGLEALSFAAEQAGLAGPLAPAAIDSIGEIPPERRRATASLVLSLAIALFLGVGAFVALPHALAAWAASLWGGLAVQSVAFQALAGGCKLLVFFAYLLLLGCMPDIWRVFMYHGAEHKVIAAYEADQPLDVAHARAFAPVHARCGTSFLLLVVLLAVALFALVFPLVPGLGAGWRGHAWAIALKVPLMLPVSGLAFEVNRWAVAHADSAWARVVLAPGTWLQRLTVSEPTDEMLEVALAALKASLSRGRPVGVSATQEAPLGYRSLADACARQA